SSRNAPSRRYPDARRSLLSSCSRSLGRGPTRGRDRAQRGKFDLAARAVERIGAPPEAQPKGDRAKVEVAPQCVDQIAPIALGQLVGAVAEHDESRRPARDL